MKNPNLPDEILIEIFSRVPARSVGKCRCLSKSWCANLSTSDFIKSHLSRTANRKDDDVTLLLLREFYLQIIRTPFDDNNALVSTKLDLPALFARRIVGSCNGLVLLLDYDDLGDKNENELFVLNPLTLHQVTIENTPPVNELTLVVYGFGYDSCIDDYKIVKLSKLYIHGNAAQPRPWGMNMDILTSVDVYSLKTGVWKRVNNSPYSHFQFDVDNGVFLNGALHWLAGSTDGEIVIAAFDLAIESFRGIPASVDNLDHRRPCDYEVFAIGGCLAIVDISRDIWRMKVWIMKEYGLESSWTNIEVVSGPDQCFRKPLLFISENEVVVSNDIGGVIVWNLTKGTSKVSRIDGDLDCITDGCTFLESLVSPIQNDVAG